MEPRHTQELLTLSRQLLAEADLHRILTHAVDHAITATGAEYGMIILFNEQGETCFETACSIAHADLQPPQFETNLALLKRVKLERRAMCLRQTGIDMAQPRPRLEQHSSRSKSHSPICMPLLAQQKLIGVLYLDHRGADVPCDYHICAFMRELSDLISLAAQRACEHRQLCQYVQSLEIALRGKHKFEAIIGHHPKMIEILKLISQVADTKVTVLIQGESGTGKELVARALHHNGQRCNHAFVPVNCAALPESLLESELFGHVRGAFTGAIKDKAGWFERAQGGTIFLDEVNEVTLPLQVKLLRVLQEGEYSRVGSTELRHSDARVLAASSSDLKSLMEQGRFREELYYRLNVVDIWVPPLRERKCDVPLLAQHFLKLYGDKFNKHDLRLAQETEDVLLAYDFPGNVRELENIIQRAAALAEDEILTPELLPPALFHLKQCRDEKKSSFKIAKAHALQQFEREYLSDCLLAAHGCITQAALLAGMDLKNFHTKMKRLGLDPHAFKAAPCMRS